MSVDDSAISDQQEPVSGADSGIKKHELPGNNGNPASAASPAAAENQAAIQDNQAANQNNQAAIRDIQASEQNNQASSQEQGLKGAAQPGVTDADWHNASMTVPAPKSQDELMEHLSEALADMASDFAELPALEVPKDLIVNRQAATPTHTDDKQPDSTPQAVSPPSPGNGDMPLQSGHTMQSPIPQHTSQSQPALPPQPENRGPSQQIRSSLQTGGASAQTNAQQPTQPESPQHQQGTFSPAARTEAESNESRTSSQSDSTVETGDHPIIEQSKPSTTAQQYYVLEGVAPPATPSEEIQHERKIPHEPQAPVQGEIRDGLQIRRLIATQQGMAAAQRPPQSINGSSQAAPPLPPQQPSHQQVSQQPEQTSPQNQQNQPNQLPTESRSEQQISQNQNRRPSSETQTPPSAPSPQATPVAPSRPSPNDPQKPVGVASGNAVQLPPMFGGKPTSPLKDTEPASDQDQQKAHTDLQALQKPSSKYRNELRQPTQAIRIPPEPDALKDNLYQGESNAPPPRPVLTGHNFQPRQADPRSSMSALKAMPAPTPATPPPGQPVSPLGAALASSLPSNPPTGQHMVPPSLREPPQAQGNSSQGQGTGSVAPGSTHPNAQQAGSSGQTELPNSLGPAASRPFPSLDNSGAAVKPGAQQPGNPLAPAGGVNPLGPPGGFPNSQSNNSTNPLGPIPNYQNQPGSASANPLGSSPQPFPQQTKDGTPGSSNQDSGQRGRGANPTDSDDELAALGTTHYQFAPQENVTEQLYQKPSGIKASASPMAELVGPEPVEQQQPAPPVPSLPAAQKLTDLVPPGSPGHQGPGARSLSKPNQNLPQSTSSASNRAISSQTSSSTSNRAQPPGSGFSPSQTALPGQGTNVRSNAPAGSSPGDPGSGGGPQSNLPPHNIGQSGQMPPGSGQSSSQQQNLPPQSLPPQMTPQPAQMTSPPMQTAPQPPQTTSQPLQTAPQPPQTTSQPMQTTSQPAHQAPNTTPPQQTPGAIPQQPPSNSPLVSTKQSNPRGTHNDLREETGLVLPHSAPEPDPNQRVTEEFGKSNIPGVTPVSKPFETAQGKERREAREREQEALNRVQLPATRAEAEEEQPGQFSSQQTNQQTEKPPVPQREPPKPRRQSDSGRADRFANLLHDQPTSSPSPASGGGKRLRASQSGGGFSDIADLVRNKGRVAIITLLAVPLVVSVSAVLFITGKSLIKVSMSPSQRAGEEAFAEGNYDRAVNYFNEAIKADDKKADLYHDRARANLRLQRYAAAVADYTSALELNKNFASARLDRAAAYYYLGDYNKAVSDYDELLKSDPNNVDAYFGRGLSYSKLKNYTPALADLNKVVQLNPHHSGAFEDIANAYLAQGQLSDAVDAYSRSLKNNPRDANAFYMRGNTYKRLGKNTEALNDFTSAIDVAPGRYEFYNDRGYALYESGKYKEAIADLAIAMQLNPNYEIAKHNLASACRKLIASIPNPAKTPEQLGDLAFAYFHSGHYADALTAANKALLLNAQHRPALNIRAALELRDRHFDYALTDADNALKIKADDKDALLTRARALMNMGRYEKAIKDYDTCVAENDNTSLFALRERALAHLLANEGALASNDAQQFLELNGWTNSLSGPTVLLWWLAKRQLQDLDGAHAALSQGETRLKATQWPYGILKFLKREITLTELNNMTRNDKERTDVRTWLGFDHMLGGLRDEAHSDFEWVKKYGNQDNDDYLLAVEQLKDEARN